jgi:hypothetical protein
MHHQQVLSHHSKLSCNFDISHPDERQKDKVLQRQSLIGNQDK